MTLARRRLVAAIRLDGRHQQRITSYQHRVGACLFICIEILRRIGMVQTAKTSGNDQHLDSKFMGERSRAVSVDGCVDSVSGMLLSGSLTPVCLSHLSRGLLQGRTRSLSCSSLYPV